MKLYNTDIELTFNDYRPLPALYGLSNADINSLYDNLLAAYNNACDYHSDLLCMALFDDIVSLKRKMFTSFVVTLSSGYIARIIGSNKYISIDKAVNNTIIFIADSDPDIIFDIPNTVESLESIIRDCYNKP